MCWKTRRKKWLPCIALTSKQALNAFSRQLSGLAHGLCGDWPRRRSRRCSLVARSRAGEDCRREVSQAARGVAASLGPYGAALHNGAEFHGSYNCGFGDLVEYHRERIRVLADSVDSKAPELLAFETLPSLEEAKAIGEALKQWPNLAAWFCFTCKDAQHVAHGELLSDCAARSPVSADHCRGSELHAAGTHPGADRRTAPGTGKPIVVYPNSGEGWDAASRQWTGTGDSMSFGALAEKWFAAGAQIVGGLLQTRPAHIARSRRRHLSPTLRTKHEGWVTQTAVKANALYRPSTCLAMVASCMLEVPS